MNDLHFKVGDWVKVHGGLAATAPLRGVVLDIEEWYSDDVERTHVWVRVGDADCEAVVPSSAILRVLDAVEALSLA